MDDKRTLLVTRTDGREFRLTIPAASRITFGPWSPPTKDGNYRIERQLSGTLRVYEGATKTSENIIAVFADVASFRDLSVDYQEKVAVEEGATMWKSDAKGYVREERVTIDETWDDVPALPKAVRRRKR
jgi:hypothetical protein